ncbi:MAG TPA: protein-glutamate O-methyltransferase CheR [Nitrosopumilaceae archaeon]|nr:protein-glutamate O-methyltransferase CheR [Nitrosopumilaceae archaeon]
MTLEISISEQDLKEITQFVHKKRGLDLSYFKPTFLSRRIGVRMKMLSMTSSSQYAQLLNSDLNELGTLYDSLSINVTKFYRDKQVWHVFGNKIIPNLLKNSKPNDQLRIWSCGCASGEEPYSLAIMFSEAYKNLDNKFKILATDINSKALQHARKGIYTSDNLKNLDSLLITKYFKKTNDGKYEIINKIKDLVSFSLADITTFPVSYIDLIFCRNLLIYYGKDAQDLIFKKFHTVLKPNRYLVLGMDETLWGHKLQNSFLSLNSRDRIYQKKSSVESKSNSNLSKKNISSSKKLANFIGDNKHA